MTTAHTSRTTAYQRTRVGAASTVMDAAGRGGCTGHPDGGRPAGPSRRSRLVGQAALLLVLAVAWSAAGAFAAEAGQDGASPQADVILEETDVWRIHRVLMTRTQGTAQDWRPAPGWDILPTPAPAADWVAPDFDDGGWPREAGPLHSGGEGGDGYGYREPLDLFRLALRGRFHVDDPSRAGDLTLKLRYRGGVAVYLNGELIATHHLPEGELTDHTHAVDYPESAYWTSDDGGNIPPPAAADERDAYHEQRQQRIRDSGRITIPASALRKGVNVLALDLRRAALPGAWAERRRHHLWGSVGLLGLELRAANPEAVRGPRQAARLPQLWNADPLARVGQSVTYGNPFEPLRPVRLVAPRGGVASGQVVLSLPAPSKDIEARLGAVRGPGGTIPADQLQVRHAVKQSPVMREAAPFYDALLPQPAVEDDTHPIWITVNVPADMPAGTYEGELQVRAPGQTLTAPVRIEVADWRIAPPGEWTPFIGMWHSPYNVAYQYGVDPWSDRHMELLRPLLRMMGQIGNDVLYINAIRNTLQSRDDTILVFRREDDRLEPDFTFVERYLEAYAAVAPAPQGVVLYAWEHSVRRLDQLPVVVRREDGSLEPGDADMFGQGDSERLWKAVVDGLRRRMDRAGWQGTDLWLGVSHDGRPQEHTVAMFRRIAPEARWNKFSHWRGDPGARDGQRVTAEGLGIALGEKPWGAGSSRDPFYGGWDWQPGDYVMTTSGRGLLQQYSARPVADDFLHALRVLPDASVTDSGRGEPYRGFTRAGLDYWQVALGDGAHGRTWEFHGWGNLYRNNPWFIAAAGPDGPVATVRYEALREGIQEAEARIAIERVLTDENLKAQVDPKLVQAFKDLQKQRLSWRPWNGYNYNMGVGWKDRTHRLFELAGRAQQVLEDND